MPPKRELSSIGELGLGGGGSIGGSLVVAVESPGEKFEGFSKAERRVRELGPKIEEQRACRGEDPALFHAPIGSAMGKRAVEICMSCTVRDECVEYGAIIGDYDSTRGGLSQRKRRALSRAMQQQGEWPQTISKPHARSKR